MSRVRVRRVSWRLSALVAGVALVATSAPVGAASECGARTSTRTGTSGTWTTYNAPRFPGGGAVSTAAVDPLDGRRWWVTDGVTVLRSLDGGCSWSQTFALPAAPTQTVPASRTTDRIRVLAVPPTRQGHETLLAAVEVNAVVSDDIGSPEAEDSGRRSATLLLGGTGALQALGPLAVPAGRPGPVAVSPVNGKVFATAGGVTQVSKDGGRTWSTASPPPEEVEATPTGPIDAALYRDVVPQVTRIALDPLDPQSMWVRAGGHIYRSSDGGATYSQVLAREERTAYPLLEVTRSARSAPRVVVGEAAAMASELRSLRIADDGKSFASRRTNAAEIGEVTGSVTSSASGPGRTDLVLTTAEASGEGSQVYAFHPVLQRLMSVDEFRIGPMTDAQRTALNGRTAFAFRAPGRLVVWQPPAGGLQLRLPPRKRVKLPEFDVPRDARLKPLSAATRVLAPRRVSIAPGQTVDVPTTLRLASEPTPLDVFFLLDTSGSMNDVIQGLAADFMALSSDLADAGIDAQFGLGDYQDTGGARYRRLVDISPPGETLRRALQSIRTDGGSEPAYTALHQMSTGTGIRKPRSGDPVPPRRGATWRPGSLRVVVHATDEVPSSDEDGATSTEAIDEMVADGTRHVGIEVVRDAARNVADSQLVPDGELNKVMKRLSRGTDALAPDGGIDCDGNGKVDVPSGQPLVCELKPLGGQARLELGGPLQRVLATLVDLQDADVSIGPKDAARDLVAMTVPGPRLVDVKRANVLEGAVRLTCPADLAGSTRTLDLRPQVGVRFGRVTPLTVVCEPLPPGAPRPEPRDAVYVVPPAAVLAAAPVLPPPAPPPAPAPAQAPAQAPAPAGAPAPAVVVQPGVALAVAPADEELQLAYVEQLVDEGFSEQPMTGREQPEVVALRLLAMAVVCGAATAVAVRRRDAVAVRRAD